MKTLSDVKTSDLRAIAVARKRVEDSPVKEKRPELITQVGCCLTRDVTNPDLVNKWNSLLQLESNYDSNNTLTLMQLDQLSESSCFIILRYFRGCRMRNVLRAG